MKSKLDKVISFFEMFYIWGFLFLIFFMFVSFVKYLLPNLKGWEIPFFNIIFLLGILGLTIKFLKMRINDWNKIGEEK